VSPARTSDLPLVKSILHPTDFSEASERAFAHALAMALLRQTRFALLNVSRRPVEQSWSEFPPVRKTLERWGLLEPDSPRSAVYRELGVEVKKIATRGRNPVRAILGHVAAEPVELIVLATEARGGWLRWRRVSVAQSVARASGIMTLVVPRDARGFVDLDDGSLALKRILVPVALEPSAQGSLEFAARAARLIGEGDVEIVLLHVGREMPRWSFRKIPPIPPPRSCEAGRSSTRSSPRPKSSTRTSSSWRPKGAGACGMQCAGPAPNRC